MEKIISSLDGQQWIAITHHSDIAAARRLGQRMAQELGFDETRAGQLAIVITEASTNMLKHAGEGTILLTPLRAAAVAGAAGADGYAGAAGFPGAADAATGVEVLACDKGPGIANLGQALRDGVSSAGTAGTGLGALKRLSHHFDVYTARDKGAVFLMRLWRGTPPPPLAGAVCLPLAGETESGDAWALAPMRGATALMMADGLGHGPEAAVAAAAALAMLAQRPALRPAAQIEACHAALRATRGAALAVALLDTAAGQLHFAGVGNIGACIVDGGPRRQLVSHNGIVGHNLRKVQEFTVPCAPGALLVMASDGISTQWDLAPYPGVTGCDPAIIAALLLRDFARGRDDASVMVLRCPEAA
jgi:anti-sigma regulatory factor (Ser/Thr protein kinase)